MTVYRIRDTDTGLFQKGGVGTYSKKVEWSKVGKTWATLGHLTSHFTVLEEYKLPIEPTWEVIEYEVTPGRRWSAPDYLAGRRALSAKRT